MNGFDLSGCTAKPQTAAGSAYLRVAADPCGENLPVDFKGIPDGSEIDIVLLRMRDDLVLTAPDDLSEDETWGLVIFDTPYFVQQQIMVRYRDSVGPPSQDTLREYLNGIRQQEMPGARYPNWFRPTVRCVEDISNTNHPRINIIGDDPAEFEVSMLRPAVLSNFGTSPTSTGWAFIRKFRFVSKGRTLHLNAPATATQGRVVSGQVGTESSPKILMQDPDSTVNNIQTPYPARFTVSPPFAFNTLPQQDLNCRQDIIKTGSYDMQRHWNGSHIWNEVEDVRPIWRANAGNLAAVWRIPTSFTSGGVVHNTQVLMKYDGFDVSMGWTVTHVDGMSGTASVHMKHRSIWEVNVPGGSPWAANKMAPCPHDAGALSLEKQLAPAIPHSFEARYNDLGLLAGLIRGVTSVGKQVLFRGISRTLDSYVPRNNVIDDPYSGRNLYGDNGFVPGGNGKGKSRKR